MFRRAVAHSMLALAFGTLSAHAQQASLRAFGIDDALHVRSSRIEDVSTDGRWVALTVRVRRDALGVDNSRYGDPTYVTPSPAEFELIDATNAQTRAILPGKVQVRGATFTKDGTRLAFFVQKGDDWTLDVYDVSANTMRQVAVHTTKQVAANSSLVWSPDGKSVLVTLRPDGWASSARAAFVLLNEGPIVVQDAKEPFLSWDRVRNLGERQIPAIVTLADGAVREVLPDTPIRGAQFSADGSYLVYSTNEPKKTSYDNTSGTEYGVFKLQLAAGAKPDTLLKPAERRVTPRWNDGASAFAYADRGNVFVRWLTADSARNLTAKYRKPASKTDTTRLAFSVVDWRPDGGALLVSAKDGYYLLDARTDSMSLVYAFEADSATRPDRAYVGWSHDGRSLFLSRSAAGRDFTDAHALTKLNPQLAGVAMSHSELVSYLDADGKRLNGVLYYPDNYEPGRKYPLVAEIYETYFDNGYLEAISLLAGRGYFAFHPSVDLQIGYPGEAWVKGVTDGINSLIEKGLVDGTKLGVEGTSYGGYATNLLITQTDRFAAAVNISGKVDIISFLGDSPKIGTRNYNAAEKGQDRIGATLWEAPLKYIQHSAIMFADRIHTPLLMLIGKQDWNVPDTNEREMYYALGRLGKEAVWVQYADAGHGAGRNGNEADFRDHWTRMFDWFGSHFEKAGVKHPASDGN